MNKSIIEAVSARLLPRQMSPGRHLLESKELGLASAPFHLRYP